MLNNLEANECSSHPFHATTIFQTVAMGLEPQLQVNSFTVQVSAGLGRHQGPQGYAIRSKVNSPELLWKCESLIKLESTSSGKTMIVWAYTQDWWCEWVRERTAICMTRTAIRSMVAVAQAAGCFFSLLSLIASRFQANLSSYRKACPPIDCKPWRWRQWYFSTSQWHPSRTN